MANLAAPHGVTHTPLSRPTLEEVVIEILTVCTGNVCRSPLAALLLRSQVADLDVRVASAGTYARNGMAMPREAVELATALGVDPADALAHTARYLNSGHLLSADLALAMAREHRRAIVELEPVLTRRTFTVRELERLTATLTDDELLAAPHPNGETADARSRFSAMLTVIAAQRGAAVPPAAGDDDDVIDPFGRSAQVYQRSADQLRGGIAALERVLRLAFV